MTLTREQIEGFRDAELDNIDDAMERMASWVTKEEPAETEAGVFINALCDLALKALDMEWRPMDSAPKDGTSVLLALKKGQAVAWWNPEFRWEEDWAAECADGDDRPGNYVGAWEDGGIETDETPMEYHPTAWMPLPQPPKEFSTDRKEPLSGAEGTPS